MQLTHDKLNAASHSGASLRIIDGGNDHWVEKRFDGDLERSFANVQKQQHFQKLAFKSQFIEAVPILDTRRTDDELVIGMPYIEGVSAEGFAVHGSKSLVSHVSEALNTLLINQMASAEHQTIASGIFCDKADAVLNATESAPLRPLVEKAVTIIHRLCADDLTFPVGSCHGDLTLSNVIVSATGEIYLIDFLQTFFESPLQDVAKVIQDLRYGWSFRYQKPALKIKGHIFCKNAWPSHLDYLLSSYPAQIEILLLLTLIRIAPYVTDETSEQWLVDALTKEVGRYA